MNNTASCNDDDGIKNARSNRTQTVAESTSQWEEEAALQRTKWLDVMRESDRKTGDYLKRRKRTFSVLSSFFGVFGFGPYLWEVNCRFQCTKCYLIETDPGMKRYYAYVARVRSAEAAQHLLRQPHRFLATMPGPGSKLNLFWFGYYLYKYIENAHEISEHEKKRQ